MTRWLHAALLVAVLTALALTLPGPACADESGEPEASEAEGDEDESRPVASSRSIGAPGDSRPSAIDPVQGLHAQAFFERLGIWAQGHGFALTRRSALYDLEGGAALRLDDGVHLIASYRMLGIDLGFDSDVEGADGEPGLAAPFIGLSFDF